MYTAQSTTVIQRGRVSNPTGSPLTFTLSLGVDSAGTRLYASTVVPALSGYNIYGPFTLAPGDIIQAFGSSTALVLELSGVTGSGVSFSTTFTGVTENPLSQGGVWKKTNPWFTAVRAVSPRAYGLYPNPPNTDLFEDSYTYLGGMGFGPDQKVSTRIYKATTGGFMEIEIHLRMLDGGPDGGGAYFTRSYECFLHQGGAYCAIAQWAGTPLTSPATASYFDVIATANNVTVPQDNDLFEAQIVGNIINISLNGVVLLGPIDVTTGGRTPITTGDPGMGMDGGGSGSETASDNYGFRSYSAVTL